MSDTYEKEKAKAKRILGDINPCFAEIDQKKVVLRYWGKVTQEDNRFSIVRSEWVELLHPELEYILREWMQHELPRAKQFVASNLLAEGVTPHDQREDDVREPTADEPAAVSSGRGRDDDETTPW
jgi:hypothetical protein